MMLDNNVEHQILGEQNTLCRKRACVIGAGSSGIAALDQLLEKNFDVTCFEARSQVGGAWILQESMPSPENGSKNRSKKGIMNLEFDEDGLAIFSAPEDHILTGPSSPTPMYKGLRTNVPSNLMAYRDRPFPDHVSLFPGPVQVSDYLQRIGDEERFKKHICLNHRVTRIRHSHAADPSSKEPSWLVEVTTTDGVSSCHEERFDYIAVANGHYTLPYVPYIRGLREWTNQLAKLSGEKSRRKEMWHSRWYAEAEQFKGKTVLVVGNSASGYDIVREIAETLVPKSPSLSVSTSTTPDFECTFSSSVEAEEDKANEPLLSHEAGRIYQSIRSPSIQGVNDYRAKDAPDWAKLIHIKPTITHCGDNGQIHFVDGSIVDNIDVIIFATGYLFSFPFAQETDAPFDQYPLTIPPPLSFDDSQRYENGTTGKISSDRFQHKAYHKPSMTNKYDFEDFLATNGNARQCKVKGGIRVHHLDERSLFYMPDPSLAFICLNLQVIPFPLAEAQARLVSTYWSGQLSHLSIQLGTPEEDPETKAPLTLGFPKEYDVQDALLIEVGDGKEEETMKWKRTTIARREFRQGCKALRKAVLGY